eukprot:TRINITY_DN61213_c0_g1_i1.p1 TRINITY_DN61213_c0_g1~~TRINITY_DN61213_c0_g1_i1.p1  ORF type:complete len:329 (+),score=28.80 TRINITY_DN61213_c0_g1_i1:100-1086(+)
MAQLMRTRLESSSAEEPRLLPCIALRLAAAVAQAVITGPFARAAAGLQLVGSGGAAASRGSGWAVLRRAVRDEGLIQGLFGPTLRYDFMGLPCWLVSSAAYWVLDGVDNESDSSEDLGTTLMLLGVRLVEWLATQTLVFPANAVYSARCGGARYAWGELPELHVLRFSPYPKSWDLALDAASVTCRWLALCISGLLAMPLLKAAPPSTAPGVLLQLAVQLAAHAASTLAEMPFNAVQALMYAQAAHTAVDDASMDGAVSPRRCRYQRTDLTATDCVRRLYRDGGVWAFFAGAQWALARAAAETVALAVSRVALARCGPSGHYVVNNML